MSREAYERAIAVALLDPQESSAQRDKLRKLLLKHGLPAESSAERHAIISRSQGSSLRTRIWKIMSPANAVFDVSAYVDAVDAQDDDSIIQDVKRTFQKDEEYRKRVADEVNARCLKAALASASLPFVQGMSLVSGVLLYNMSELEAFYMLKYFYAEMCPAYVSKEDSFEGVLRGCELVAKLVTAFDPVLSKHMKEKEIEPRAWAFPCMCVDLTCAQTFHPF